MTVLTVAEAQRLLPELTAEALAGGTVLLAAQRALSADPATIPVGSTVRRRITDLIDSWEHAAHVELGIILLPHGVHQFRQRTLAAAILDCRETLDCIHADPDAS